jgi:hypothetical protein
MEYRYFSTTVGYRKKLKIPEDDIEARVSRLKFGMELLFEPSS